MTSSGYALMVPSRGHHSATSFGQRWQARQGSMRPPCQSNTNTNTYCPAPRVFAKNSKHSIDQNASKSTQEGRAYGGSIRSKEGRAYVSKKTKKLLVDLFNIHINYSDTMFIVIINMFK